MTYVKIIFFCLISFCALAQTVDQYKTTTAAGSVNTYTIPNSDFGAYRTNEKWLIDFTGVTTNSGACTLNRFGLGAISIKMPDGTNPPSGTLSGRMQLSYNGTVFYIVGGAGSGGGGSGTVTNVSATSPLFVTSPTTTPNITIQVANTSQNGYLTNTDWNTFNNKLSAFGSQTANFFYAAPNGSAGSPSFRAMVAADVPTLNQNTTGSAATLTTPRTISISGDLTYTSPSFDGSGNVTAAGTLATVNSSPGSFGSATKSLTATVNGKGLITALSEQTVTPAIGSITGLGTNWPTALAASLGSGWTTALNAAYSSGSGTVTTVSVVSANGFAGSVANATTTPAITLTTSITGILKGNGTAISAATDGTDYLSPTTIGYSSTSLNVNILGQSAKNLQLGAGVNVYQTITTNGMFTFSSGTVDATALTPFTFSPGSQTNITASTQNPLFRINMAADFQWATGNFTSQPFALIDAPTVSFIGASTITKPATLTVTGSPIAGANATLTFPASIWSQGGVVDVEDNTTNALRGLQLSRNVNDANGSFITFQKNRAALGTLATVSSGDNVGGIRTYLYDGTQYTTRTPILFQLSAAVSSGKTPTDIIFQVDNAGTETEAGRIRQDGSWVTGSSGTQAYRTTNAGSATLAEVMLDPASAVTSGKKGYAFTNANGFIFTVGNASSRRIEFFSMVGTNFTTTAGSEAGDVTLSLMNAGAAVIERHRMTSLGTFMWNTTTVNSTYNFAGINTTGPATNGWLTTGVQFAIGGATYTDPQAAGGTRATAVGVSIAQPTFTNAGAGNVTATDGSTFYIANAPTTSNTSTGSYTLTRAWAVTVAAGNIASGGKIFAGGTATTPTALLHLAAGTASANTSPLKFTSGTSLTTTEAGAMEFDGSDFYGTLTNSGTRFKIARVLTNTASLDFGSVASLGNANLTITVTGAALGDAVAIGVPNGAMTAGLVWDYWVSATDTVTIQVYNSTLGAIDPASGTFKATVIKN